MKRQKRDMQERAFARGYRAGVERRSKDLAPAGPTHDDWMAGWRSGREDNWDGYTGVSGIHRMAGNYPPLKNFTPLLTSFVRLTSPSPGELGPAMPGFLYATN